ncbi:MAG TPA: ATP-binding domain-containing protein [Myxococcales bacterium]|nr:ATP-binding domain-containing protein [Myxococcales bacterium]
MTRLEQQLDILARAKTLLPQSRAPYYAHLKLRMNGRGLNDQDIGHEADILLGAVFRRGAGVTIVDWRTAPLSEIFFGYEEGEEYDLDLTDRRVTGLILQRNLVTFRNGELIELQWPKGRLVRDLAGFREAPRIVRPRLKPRDPGLRARPPSPVDVELDAAQKAVVDLPAREAVLVLGEAGCGKTTVALHRLSKLCLTNNERYRAACIVPNEGLRLLIESLLHRLGLDDVETWTYEKFASKQARRVFPDLRRRESEDEGPLLSRLKRHEALRPILQRLAKKRPPKSEDDMVGRARHARREDLQTLFGDPALMAEVIQASGIPSTAAKEAVDHTRVQFTASTERDYSHVDESRLTAVDGRAIDEGTPDTDAETVDPEDYAVMFELERLRAENFDETPISPSRYHCLLVDEAQELAPLELALLGRCVARGGTIIVAGDAAQQVDAAANFKSWDTTMAELGAAQHQKAVLEVSYRCPPEVTAFARHLRHDEGRAAYPLARFDTDAHLAAWLVEALRDLDAADPSSASAVICRTPEAASLLARVLRFGLPVRLALEGKFVFGPGVSVTCVPEVKGLEFDHVVLPDAARAQYADAAEARRALYVAATRASSQLLLAASGEPSPLIG